MSDLNIGKVIIDQTKTSQVVVNYQGTSRPNTTTIISNRTQMTATVDSISTVFEVSKTYYFDADGGLVTTNQGYGTLGTTDSDGVLTVAHLTPSLALTAPSAGTKYKLSESFNVTWTSSNITLVNIILESESGGYKIFENVNASLGTLAVSILASDGFSINETVYIYIENTHQSIDDSVQVQSIATVIITGTPTTAGVEENITGLSNGDEVEGFYRLSSGGGWISAGTVSTVLGAYTIPVTIPDADTYDFKVEDTTDRDGSAQVDDVVVASGEIMIDDFESYTVGTHPPTYSGTPWNTVAAFESTYDDTYAYSGTKSMKCRCNQTGYSSVFTRTLSSGMDLTGKKISLMIRRDSNTDVSRYKIRVRSGLNECGSTENIDNPAVSDSSFTELAPTLTFGLSSSNITQIRIEIYTSKYGGTVWIDDLKII